jgi:hypothetical protein
VKSPVILNLVVLFVPSIGIGCATKNFGLMGRGGQRKLVKNGARLFRRRRKMSTNPLPEQAVSPPEVEQQTKAITVYVRFAGVDKIEMEVPADLDLTDPRAITDYLNGWTKEHRPFAYQTVVGEAAEQWEYTNMILGEYWQESKYNKWKSDFNQSVFNDPEAEGGQPRIFIESVEEGVEDQP